MGLPVRWSGSEDCLGFLFCCCFRGVGRGPYWMKWDLVHGQWRQTHEEREKTYFMCLFTIHVSSQKCLVTAHCFQIFTLSFPLGPLGILYIFWILILCQLYVLWISLPSLKLISLHLYAILLYTQMINFKIIKSEF